MVIILPLLLLAAAGCSASVRREEKKAKPPKVSESADQKDSVTVQEMVARYQKKFPVPDWAKKSSSLLTVGKGHCLAIQSTSQNEVKLKMIVSAQMALVNAITERCFQSPGYSSDPIGRFQSKAVHDVESWNTKWEKTMLYGRMCETFDHQIGIEAFVGLPQNLIPCIIFI
ncbi:MAG: hypothetical protein COV45_01575 [Deltaproteobacteria bacterium CG11_big_fil_rev_8_21_14_0_20_47_16]|nr:MAG: hypothetical protein COV45_01575 [Deltaproteobacteria bacterium CG11_big_fil_rev_8_21_14_0_20_47_16]